MVTKHGIVLDVVLWILKVLVMSMSDIHKEMIAWRKHLKECSAEDKKRRLKDE
jgi:hypothetical protein